MRMGSRAMWSMFNNGSRMTWRIFPCNAVSFAAGLEISFLTEIRGGSNWSCNRIGGDGWIATSCWLSRQGASLLRHR